MKIKRIPWLLALVCAFCLFVPQFGSHAQTTHGVTLTWTAPAVTATAGPAASYNILRGTTSGGESATPIATGITALTYLDTTGIQGTKYFYEVTATNAAGTSAPSTEVSATFLVTGAPGAPGSVAASAN